MPGANKTADLYHGLAADNGYEESMKTLLSICAVLALAFGAANMKAADLTGTWTASMQMPGGDAGGGMTITYTLKQDGATLTGSMISPMGGDPIVLSNGKVDGNNVSFDISVQGMTIHNTGTVDGDTIKLSSKSDGGEMPPMDMMLKRGAAAAPAAPTAPAAPAAPAAPQK